MKHNRSLRRESGRPALLATCKLSLVAGLLLLIPTTSAAQWASSPGQTVRDAFGPATGGGARVCRGACGVGCPSACAERTIFECIEGEKLQRVRSFTCGTHQGCRDHDDCLDRCSQRHGAGFDCDAECHREAVEEYGLELAVSWAAAGGPFDGEPITFEYTRDSPDAPAPAFRCPSGSTLECTDDKGRCAADGKEVQPVFDSYPSAGPGAMKISSFKSGRLCGQSVCSPAIDIDVTGEDSCNRNGENVACTRYGVEFDYRGADPSSPLECSTSTSGSDDDFIGGLIKRGFDSAPTLGADTFEGNQGLGELLGIMQKVVASAESPEDVRISMAPLGPDGKPIEEQRVGNTSGSGPPRVPKTVPLTSASGHLVVPMYELASDQPTGSVTEREVRCSHGGVPVFETTFRLHE
jgi:hypothetical protein